MSMNLWLIGVKPQMKTALCFQKVEAKAYDNGGENTENE